ncbi:hypothetical protein MSAN_01692400 [Mycena sanguinolenta]|uniref:Ribonuclease H1 N-terminal domain-containing protein n=1 Tax=Mycena sanguinolenta TaxID=230812 RepID=A0A8H7CTD1_9AGAR|nr:hypothetical protein MSAN_01692400 [Mycena sanguinolenta]
MKKGGFWRERRFALIQFRPYPLQINALISFRVRKSGPKRTFRLFIRISCSSFGFSPVSHLFLIGQPHMVRVVPIQPIDSVPITQSRPLDWTSCVKSLNPLNFPFHLATGTMTTFSTTAANATTTDRAEVMAVLATVDDLVARTTRLSRVATQLQQSLPPLLQRLSDAAEAAEAAAAETPQETSPAWVRDTPKTPAQVATEHADLADGSRILWVVYVGREPGVYTTVESADMQIKGCLNQQYRRKSSKQEALQFYTEKFDAGLVQKWVEVIPDD